MSIDFQPKFIVSDSLDQTADLINRPHEDYPDRVPQTLEVLANLLLDPVMDCLEADHVKHIHAHIMHDLEPVSDRGNWRTCNVTVGGRMPVHHSLVADELRRRKLFPVGRHEDCGGNHWYERPWEWYRHFQEVHPFRDGNGRVGGVVLALLTYSLADGTVLAPLQ